MLSALELQMLYARIPKIECKGKCWRACGPIVASDLELVRVTHASGKSLDFSRESLECNMLDPVFKTCRVYNVRPLICRLFGAVDSDLMRCPHGCKPDAYLTDKQAHSLIAESLA